MGASVVFRNGKPEKSEYRTYRVKGGSMDDLGMMSEVVQRWVMRLETTRPSYSRWRKTHLTTIVGMLEDLGHGDKFPVIALAKKRDGVYNRWSRVADGQTWKNDNPCPRRGSQIRQ